MLFLLPEDYPRGMHGKGADCEERESVAASSDRREIPDGYLRGLYLIVQPSGAKSWAVRYRHDGRPRKHTLGPYPLFDLKAAREAGSKALRVAAEGHDPAHVRSRQWTVSSPLWTNSSSGTSGATTARSR